VILYCFNAPYVILNLNLQQIVLISMITLNHISLKYDSKILFSDLTLSFSAHRVTALLGKSGSGKSSLLQLLNGMLRPASGQVEIFGQTFDYKNAAQMRLGIGYAVQQVGLFPHLTVFENIRLLGKVTNMKPEATQQRVFELMEMVQLDASYTKKFPYQLSGGEAQRVGLCRALFLRPKILLMDEPFAALDSTTKRGIYDYFLALQQSASCTVVLVTHDWQEAAYLADEYILLENGNIAQSGTQSQLLKML
jgi:osmoprotectant transport system ATP-binding protein